MKLQISFEMVDLERALSIAQQVAPFAAIFEIGGLLLYKYGAKSIEEFRAAFPDKVLLADAKIIDRGKDSVTLLCQAGADWVTVMAGTRNHVIHAATNAAHATNCRVMVDLLDATSLGQSALEAKSLGADALLFHESYEEQEALAFVEHWNMVRGNTTLPVFISGKINRNVIDHLVALKPDGIVIGKAITEAADPVVEAQFYAEKCTL